MARRRRVNQRVPVGEKPGEENKPGGPKHILPIHRQPYDEAFKRTKDVKRPEGMSDEDYAKKQEAYKTRRGNRARRLLKHTYGKKWGKRVYEGKAESAKYRQKQVSKLGKLKERESSLAAKVEGKDPGYYGPNLKAMQKRLETLREKKKSQHETVAEFRGQRKEAMQAAYKNPAAARKQYPKERTFSGKVQDRKGGKVHIGKALTTGGPRKQRFEGRGFGTRGLQTPIKVPKSYGPKQVVQARPTKKKRTFTS